MTSRNGLARVCRVGVLVALFPVPEARPAEAPPTRAIAAKDAVAPATPVLPASVVAALQEGRYAEARDALAALSEKVKNGDEKAYYALIRGIAQRLGGEGDLARRTFAEALETTPKGPWAAKLRFELAVVELAAGRYAAAEELARAEAETLLAGGRKDRLAGVYHAFARKLLKPDDPVTPADPNGAYDLLLQARGLAKGEALRAELLLAMGRASQAANNHGRALQDFQTYVHDYPRGVDRFSARFHLGEAQFLSGQLLPARLTWTDLARELGEAKGPLAKDQAEVRAKALYEVARTYGVPSPGDDTSLNLGVAALRRFLTAYPAHPWAVKAAYEVGAVYLARGKSQEALDAFRSFLKEDGFQAETDEAKRDLAQWTMTATFQIGQVLQGQGSFAEAVAAWKGYLAKFPNGPQSADAQRAILDAQLLAAADHLRREQFADARTAWQTFVASNPLDPRVPQVLFQIGDSVAQEKRFDQAVAAWEPLIGKFPQSEPAAHAQFLIAAIYETEKGEPAEAIERFRKVAVEPWRSQAMQRVAVMESRALTVVTPRAFRSGEKAHLKIATRNLEKLTFTVYKLDAEAYFRKKHTLSGVESLDVGLVRPDAEWTADVPKYAKYKPVEAEYELKAGVPGVHVVKVTDEKHLQATTLVLGSDLDAIVKTSAEQVLVFAQDMKTGAGRAGARVLVSDGGQVVLDARTGKDGVLLQAWDKPRQPGAGLHYLVLDGADAAGSGLGVPQKVAQGLTARAYIYADRPAYRPGQRVALRGVVREVKDGQYLNAPKAVYRLEATDSRGRTLISKTMSLSDFGTFHESIPLDESAPAGTYQVRVFQPGGSSFAGQFEVQSYQLEKMDLSFDLKKTVFYRGETVKADLVAKYQYGAPAARRPVAVQLPDGRILHGETDADGKYHVEFPTTGFAEEQALRLVAQLPQDNVATAATVMLAVRAFGIGLATTRDVYLDGESFALRVSTRDAQGEPVGETLSVAILKQVQQAGRLTEREVKRLELKTDPKTGEGTLSLKVDDDRGGGYIVRVAGTDRFGNPVVADRALSVSGKKDETKLRILADRQSYKVGEEASVNLHSRGASGTALLAWEADRVLTYRLVKLQEGDNAIGWAVDGAQFPNFTLTAARMAGARFDEAKLDVKVERDLRVEIKPIKPAVGPGDEVEVEVTTVDQLGRPASAEVSLALVDRSLLRLYGDKLPPIGPFFYNQMRVGAFATQATNTFKYEPATTPVSEAVVEEEERGAAQQANAAERARVADEVQKQVALNMPATYGAQPPMGTINGGFSRAAPSSDAPPMPALRRKLADGVESDKKAKLESLSETFSDLGAKDAEEKKGDRAEWSVDFAFRSGAAGGKSATQGRAAGMSVQPRRQFVETAYWNPSVVTDKGGKAKLTFRAPTALSAYRFTARGVTAGDSLVGQTTAEIVVRKDFFVDLKTPAALTQGDKPRFVGRLHHVGVSGKAELRLSVYAGGREQVYLKALALKDDGVDDVYFDPFEVPDGDIVRLTLTATSGDSRDRLVTETPIRPWGARAFASASGASSDGATVFVGLPPGRAYEGAEMLIVVSPTLRRLVVELALGRDAYPLGGALNRCVFPAPPDSTADRAGDLLAATSALGYLRASGGAAAPEAARLTERAQGLVAELIGAQGDDGGWPWVGSATPIPNPQPRPGDRATSARVVWALASAEPFGLLADPKALDKAAAYLTQEFAKTGAADRETRVLLLHALSARKKATFEQANALNRERNALSDAGLAYLALTLVNLDRASLANEALDVLLGRVQTEPTQPGRPTRSFWKGNSSLPFNRGPVEATALAALAFSQARPRADVVAKSNDWLLAHRQGEGWAPNKAKGPAVAAVAAYHGTARAAEDRYDLVVTVNDVEVLKTRVAGASEGRAVLVPRKALKAGDANRVRFEINGRGTFGYAVTLTGFARDFGPDQNRAGRTAMIDRRVYHPAQPELDGKVLPTGFGVAVNPTYFENVAGRVALGGKARVQLVANRYVPGDLPEWERDFLIVEEHLPAGTTLIEGSVQSQADGYALADGVLTFYFAPDRWPGSIQYDVYGYVPGQYRALPASIRSAYEPGKAHLGPASELRVTSPGEPNPDPYKPTPDELYARGKAHFDAGRLGDAADPLEALFTAYTLRDDVAKDAARMLLLINIQEFDARKVVRYFEVVKEKAPELVLTFEQLSAVGKAYRDVGEHERAYLVWKGVVEASYLEDARVGEVLRQRGKTLEGIAYLLALWREHPNTPSIESDFFGLSQVVGQLALKAIADPPTRRELAAAGIVRSDLLAQTIRLTQTFLATSPADPQADEASLALVGAFLELEDHPAVVKLSARFAKLYPKSPFLDSFQYAEALGEFHLGRHDRAVAVAESIAEAVYKDANGVDQPSPNKWQAVYILGQIFDARRQPARALTYYEQVAERFSDAAGAVKFFTRKDLKLPEVSVASPDAAPPAPAVGLRAVAPDGPARVKADAHVKLQFRNVADADVKVFPVDLMRLYLTRRNLDQIAGIDLAGITPLLEKTVKLGTGADFADRAKDLDLPLAKEGAFLVMVRGGDLYASGIVLVTPLEMEVLEEPDAGRVRVTVRDARTKDLVPKVQVKVIGGANPAFISGETDLRGVFVAEGVLGEVTAVARKGEAQYAFHRGKTYVGTPPTPNAPNAAPQKAVTSPMPIDQSLDANLKTLNCDNQLRQFERLKSRYQEGGKGGASVKGFK